MKSLCDAFRVQYTELLKFKKTNITLLNLHIFLPIIGDPIIGIFSVYITVPNYRNTTRNSLLKLVIECGNILKIPKNVIN